jgi:hypothetical protein
VTERAAYIGRIRNLSRSVAQAYFDSRERLGFPMLVAKVQPKSGLTRQDIMRRSAQAGVPSKTARQTT